MARKSSSASIGARRTPRKSALTEPIPVDDTPKKRGRPAATATGIAAEPPKKRGRPAKVPVQDTPSPGETPRRRGRRAAYPESKVAEAPLPKKTTGRSHRPQSPTQDMTVPKKRMGRPKKAETIKRFEAAIPATPKRRGRPPRTAQAVDLNRVAHVGPPRIAKRASKTGINPRIRSKLRTRLPIAQKLPKEESAPQPAKRRGRPPTGPSKVTKATKTTKATKAAKATKAPATVMPTSKRGRIIKASQPKVVKAPPPAAATAKAPRKKRGFTVLEIPDRFVVALKQHLQELQDAEALPPPADEEAKLAAEIQEQAERILEDGDDTNADVSVENDASAVIVTTVIEAPKNLGQEVDVEPSESDEKHESGVRQQEPYKQDLQPSQLRDEDAQDTPPEEPTEVATEIDDALSIHEEPLASSATGEAEVFELVHEHIELHEAAPASLLDSSLDNPDASIHHALAYPGDIVA